MDNCYINLGNLIKEKRIEKGLNIQQLATILDVSTGFVSNLENSKSDVFNVDLISKLCQALDMSPLNFLPEVITDDTIYGADSSNLSPERDKELILKNIATITTAYIESIKHHSYDIRFINQFTDKILSEINYINDFKLR